MAEQNKDIFAEIAAQSIKYRDDSLVEPQPIEPPDKCLPSQQHNPDAIYNPKKKIDSAENLDAELKNFRETFVPFTKNLAPKIAKEQLGKVAAFIHFDSQKDFFIGFDSDGCVFDSMELKHKECFCPAVIKNWGLQGISKYARQVWDFVNLYSKTRGCNRFLALIELFAHLERRKDLQGREISWPDLSALIEWTKAESKLGNATLEEYLKSNNDSALKTALQWSLDVNKNVDEMDTLLPPFPFVRKTLAKAEVSADIMVVSQTPVEALEREWSENGIDKYIRFIAGQEHGTKTEHIKYASAGKYDPDKILMVGDAPGDLQAAKANGSLFFPIVPGNEEHCWEILYKTALDKFFNGSYSGKYEQELIAEFNRQLSDTPPWECANLSI